jgi:hypothetical protein
LADVDRILGVGLRGLLQVEDLMAEREALELREHRLPQLLAA